MKSQVFSAILKSGACNVGIVSASMLLNAINKPKKDIILKQNPSLGALIMCIFPYYAGAHAGDISLYARGLDYHKVIIRRLEQSIAELSAAFPHDSFNAYTDISPFPEVWCASAAGLGVIGKNGLLLTPKYGSFVFIATIATSLPLSGGAQPKDCIGCGKCIAACPTCALSDHGFDESHCLSAITQRRGELSSHERELIKARGIVWGCDICQLVCPQNTMPTHTALPEFSQALIHRLPDEVLSQSDRIFRTAFADHAFSWRGVAPLKRNHSIVYGK